MQKRSMLSGLLVLGIPLAGLWAKKRMERNRTAKGSIGGYTFSVKKDK